MRHSGDAKLLMTINQGIAGEAVYEKAPIYDILTGKGPETYNFSDDQYRRTESLKFVFSFPIRQMESESDTIDDKIIGIVSAHSESNGSEILIEDETRFKALFDDLATISDLCTLIL